MQSQCYSQVSAYDIITIPAEVYAFGWQQMLMIPTIGFVLLLTSYVTLPVFHANNIKNCYAVCSDQQSYNRVAIIQIFNLLFLVLGNAFWKDLPENSDEIIYDSTTSAISRLHVSSGVSFC